jgi:hypothetical protein
MASLKNSNRAAGTPWEIISSEPDGLSTRCISARYCSTLRRLLSLQRNVSMSANMHTMQAKRVITYVVFLIGWVGYTFVQNDIETVSRNEFHSCRIHNRDWIQKTNIRKINTRISDHHSYIPFHLCRNTDQPFCWWPRVMYQCWSHWWSQNRANPPQALQHILQLWPNKVCNITWISAPWY